MLRFILDILFVVVFLLLSIPVWGVLFIIGLFDKKAKDRIGFAIVRWAFKVVWLIAGVKLEVNGLEKVPKDSPVLYVANHEGLFDIVIAYSLCPSVTGFLSKQTFGKVPLLNVWMKMLYCIFLTRDNPREDLKKIILAQEHLKNSVSIFVFPEGTRSKNGEMIPFHEAPVKIALKAGVPIVPVAITGTRDRFERQLPRLKGGKVVFTYCDPIDTKALEGDDKKFPGAYAQKIIAEQLKLDAAKVK